MASAPVWRPWPVAWQQALYGEQGFYLRPEGPAGHFRTAAHAAASGLLGQAVARLARATGCTSVVDVGAGRGELLAAVAAADPALRLTGVDVAPRPKGLDPRVAWLARAPSRMTDTLLVGWELLDVVPCAVLEVDAAGVARQVEVAPDGAERRGAPASAADLAWCRQWWPVDAAPAGSRVEVGRARDEVWAGLVSALHSGLAVAVDYGHDRSARPGVGTLTGFAGGRQVRPVPDGSTDITAHVALDSVAAAGHAVVSGGPAFSAGGPRTARTARAGQRQVLSALGVSGRRPALALATTDPRGYVAAMAAAGEAAELLDPGGLGGFGWVLHAVGPTASAGLARLLDTDSTRPQPS